MEKKKYIVLLLQIAAVAAAGVIGGDTLFALVTALIGITFNFMVSMNFAPGFLFGLSMRSAMVFWHGRQGICDLCIYDFYAGSDGSLQFLEMERGEETDGNHHAEDEPQGAECYGPRSDGTVWNYSGCPFPGKWNAGYQCFL